MLTITPDDDFNGATLNVNGKYLKLDFGDITKLYCESYQYIRDEYEGPLRVNLGDDTEVFTKTEWQLAYNTTAHIITEHCDNYFSNYMKELEQKSLH